MTSKEALNEIKLMFKGIDKAECFDYDISNQEYYKAIEKDLNKITELEEEVYRLSKIIKNYQQAINDIAAKKPATPLFSNYVYGKQPDLNQYIKSLLNYITELSNTDNLIISAVYERLKNWHSEEK